MPCRFYYSFHINTFNLFLFIQLTWIDGRRGKVSKFTDSFAPQHLVSRIFKSGKTDEPVIYDYITPPKTSGNCLMTFLSERWRPGSKGVFDWRLIPCHKKYNTYILICQVGNFAKNQAMYLHQAIVYFNFLHFEKQVLDASCSDENRVTLSRLEVSKPLVYFGTNIRHQTLTSLRNVANILSPFYHYQNRTFCLNVVQLTTSKSVMSVTAVSMDRGQIQTNLYRCTKSWIAVLNGCFSVIKLQSNAMTAIDQGNITNPAILALVNMLQHHHVCHVYMFHGSDKHSYVTHHPWCHGNLSAVVNMEQPHSIITDIVCGPWQVMCDNSQCMSEWVRGEGLHQCSSTGTLRPHVFACDSSSILSVPWYRVCDSVTDCSDMSDENLCNKESLTKPLMVPHKDTIQTPKKVEPAFHCKFTERVLPLDYVEDFLPDCYSSKLLLEGAIADEDLISPSFDIEQSINMTFDAFPCLQGHPLHFPFHVICHYDLNKHGRLRYCGNGAHLSGCVDHGCSNMFKCPGSYCLAVIRVCDGVADCPDGEDERDCSSQSPSCPWNVQMLW